MEIVFCFLKKYEFGEFSEFLIDFIDWWFVDLRLFLIFFFLELWKVVLLMYVVLFYEFLEDLLVDLVIEGIYDMYWEELLSDIRE